MLSMVATSVHAFGPSGTHQVEVETTGSFVPPDCNWIVGKYTKGIHSFIHLNAGFAPARGLKEDQPTKEGEMLDISPLTSGTKRHFKAVLTNPGVPCASYALIDKECPYAYDGGSPVYGNRTTVVFYEMEGTCSYNPKKANEIEFYTDHIEYLVANGSWIKAHGSGSHPEDDMDTMTCSKFDGSGRLVCDLHTMDTAYSGEPGFWIDPHYQIIGTWLWNAAA